MLIYVGVNHEVTDEGEKELDRKLSNTAHVDRLPDNSDLAILQHKRALAGEQGTKYLVHFERATYV